MCPGILEERLSLGVLGLLFSIISICPMIEISHMSTHVPCYREQTATYVEGLSSVSTMNSVPSPRSRSKCPRANPTYLPYYLG